MSKQPKDSKDVAKPAEARAKKPAKKPGVTRASPSAPPAAPAAATPDASANGGGTRQAAILAGAAAGLFLMIAMIGALVATRYYWEPIVVTHVRALLGLEVAADPLAALDARLKALESAPGVASEPPAIDALRAEGDRLSDRMGDLVGRVNGLDQALRTLRGQVEGSGSDTDRADLEALRETLSRRLDAARNVDGGRLEALEKGKVDLLQRLQAVADRLATLESNVVRQADRLAQPSALVLAISHLRRAVEDGGGFMSELDMVARFAGERDDMQPHIDALRGLAGDGVASLVGLQRRFDEVVGAMAAAGGAEGTGWVDRLMGRVGAIVSVRRTDVTTGNATDAILTRAQAHLAAGNLSAAVAELRGLSAAARAPAEPWLADANRRLAAQAAVQALETALLSGGGAARG